MPSQPQVENMISREREKNNHLTPPKADYEDFDEEIEMDEIDGENIPLHDVEKGTLMPRRFIPRKRSGSPNSDPNDERALVPNGYYPQWPTYYPEQVPPDPTLPPNMNLFQQKKSMAQGMLDLALLSANANQLRYVLDSNERNHYYYVSLSLISSSLVLQVLVAIALVFKSRYNMDNIEDYVTADRMNNFIMIGILLITIANVISSAFAPNS